MLTRWTASGAVIFFVMLSDTAMAGKGLQVAGTVKSEDAAVRVVQKQFGCKRKVKKGFECINHRKRVCTRTTHANCKVVKSCTSQVFGNC